MTAKILVNHGNCPVEEVPQVIGQLIVDTAHIILGCKGSVRTYWQTAHEVVTERIKTKALHQHFWIDHIALGLGHLAVLHDEPTVSNQAVWQLHIQHHEHDRPVDGVETQNVLAHHMEDCPVPEFVIVGVVFLTVAQGRRIVEQGVNPDIDDMLGIRWHWHSPGKGSPRYRQILQARLDEVSHDFIHTAVRLDKVRMRLEKVH